MVPPSGPSPARRRGPLIYKCQFIRRPEQEKLVLAPTVTCYRRNTPPSAPRTTALLMVLAVLLPVDFASPAATWVATPAATARATLRATLCEAVSGVPRGRPMPNTPRNFSPIL